MNRASATRLLPALAAIALVLTAVAISCNARTNVVMQPPAPYIGTPVDPPKLAADAVLADQNGKPAHLYDSSAGATFLFFGYTHCPDACPLALASLGRAYRTLAPAQAAKTRIVFVTVDPERDVPAVMKRYVANFDAHIIGLTGTRAQLSPVWDAYGVAIDAKTKELAHGDAIYAIDRAQHAILIYPSNTKSSDLAHDAALLVNAK